MCTSNPDAALLTYGQSVSRRLVRTQRHGRLLRGGDTKAKLLAHHGAGLIQPQGRECLPQPEFLAWHRAEVFKEPARE